MVSASQGQWAARCDHCGEWFASGVESNQAWFMEAPVEPRCPECGSTGHIPELVEAIRIIDSLTDETRAELDRIVRDIAERGGTFDDLRRVAPAFAGKLNRLSKDPRVIALVVLAFDRYGR